MDWYINLPPEMDRGDAKNHGPDIKISVERSKFTPATKNIRMARWTFSWSPKEHDHYFNKQPKFKSGQSAGTLSVDAPEVQNKFSNVLEVPVTGGVKYRVQVKKSPNQGQDDVGLDEEYTAKRALYYQFEYMNDACKSLFESIVDGWKRAFGEASIDLLPRGECMKLNDEAITIRDPQDFTLSRRQRLTIDRRSYHLRIVVVNDIADKKDRTLEFTFKRTTNTPDVAYQNSIIKIKTGHTASQIKKTFKVESLLLKPNADSVNVAVDFITIRVSSNLQDVRIGLNDDRFAAIWRFLEEKKNVTVSGVFRGRVAENCRVTAQLGSANAANNRVTAGGMRLWVEGGNICIEPAEDSDFCVASVLLHSSTKPSGNLSVLRVGAKQVVLALAGKNAEALKTGQTIGIDINLRVLKGQETTLPFRGTFNEIKDNKRTMTGGDMSAWQKSINITPKEFWAASVSDVTATGSSSLDLTAQAAAVAAWSDDRSEIRIDVTQAALSTVRAALEADRDVGLEIKYSWIQSVGGYHTENTDTIVLTTLKVDPQENPETTKNRLLRVAIHETGHALGLVRDSQQMQGWSEPNDRHYIFHGGRGSHCKLNAHAVDCAQSPESPNRKRMVPDDGNSKICVMFHTMHYLDRIADKFCDTCKNHLIRNDVKLALPALPQLSQQAAAKQ